MLNEQFADGAQDSAAIAVQHLLEKTADRWPQSPSVSFEGKTFTWEETYSRCHHFSLALGGLGVVSGDRVAYLGFNSHWCFELFFAAPMTGAIVVPVNFRLSISEVITCLEDAEPVVLLVDEHHHDQAAAIMRTYPSLRVVYAGHGEVPDDMLGYEELLARAESIGLSPSGND
ncbi:MAG: AMP-binding protein, partial [Marinobacter sp.]